MVIDKGEREKVGEFFDSLSFERGLNNTSSKFSNKFYHGSFVSRDTIRYERLISEGLMEGYYGNGIGYGIFGTISKWVEIGPIMVLPVDRSKLISGD